MTAVSLYPPYKVVVVDDDEDIAEAIEDLMRDICGAKVEVAVCTEVEDAVGKIKSEGIDILITDLNMPGMYGDMLIQEVKKHSPATFCLICTGCPSLSVATSARRDGVHGFLEKPFSRDSIEKNTKPFLELLDLWHEAIKSQLKAG